jgi:hypothetical protein
MELLKWFKLKFGSAEGLIPLSTDLPLAAVVNDHVIAYSLLGYSFTFLSNDFAMSLTSSLE